MATHAHGSEYGSNFEKPLIIILSLIIVASVALVILLNKTYARPCSEIDYTYCGELNGTHDSHHAAPHGDGHAAPAHGKDADHNPH